MMNRYMPFLRSGVDFNPGALQLVCFSGSQGGVLIRNVHIVVTALEVLTVLAAVHGVAVIC